MAEDFEVELQENNITQKGQIQLPMNFLLFGEVENDDVKVYIKQDVYKALEKYALADIEHERGTIILGDYCDDLGKTHVIISNYIEAKYTDASASTLTFTHETWEYVHKEQDTKFPDKKIVGWQHTHPNYGIFLSNYDLFIHENFFNLPFQIAYVIDPIQNIRGFFQWKNGKVEKLKGYYVYDDVGKPIKIEQKKIKQSDTVPEKTATSKLLLGLVSLLLIATVVLGISTASLNRLYKKQLQMQNDIKETVSAQQSEIKKQSETISELQKQLINNVIYGNGQSATEYLLERLEKNEIQLDNQAEVISELKRLIQNNKSQDNEVKYIMYTVKSGDTLLGICKVNGVDYYSSKNIVLSINGLKDPNVIKAGQKLVLPVVLNND